MPIIPLVLTIGVAVWIVGYMTVVGVQESHKVRHCRQCGAKYTHVRFWPTETQGLREPEKICANGHSQWSAVPPGESATDRLGGWAP
jgi:hypothetical protein